MINTAHMIALFMSLVMLSYCNECQDCDGVISEPNASFTFIDFDSLMWVESNLTSITDSLLYIDSVGEELSLISEYLKDSLKFLTDSIENGGLLEEERILIIDQISLIDSLTFINEENDDHYTIKINEMNKIQTALKMGNLMVDTVFNLFNDQYQILENLASRYEIPLNYNDSLSSFGFSISGHFYFINLQHTNELIIDVRGNAIVSISQIDTVPNAHNFANISIQCQDLSCKANETDFTCYY